MYSMNVAALNKYILLYIIFYLFILFNAVTHLHLFIYTHIFMNLFS